MPDRGVPSRGFRFSVADAVVLISGAALTWALWAPIGQFALLVPVTLLLYYVKDVKFVALLYVVLLVLAAWGLAGWHRERRGATAPAVRPLRGAS